jgi:hypothetical protein
MQCVDYDTHFQHNLAAKFPTFVPKPKDRSKKPSGAGGSPVIKQPKSKAGQKRKRGDKDVSDGDADKPDGDWGLETEGPAYKVRGTRSRPM